MPEVVNTEDVSQLLSQLEGEMRKSATAAALRRSMLLVQREARRNAPRSPSRKQVSASLVRKRRTSRICTPGGLEKSIEAELYTDGAMVFVAANSYAGKYAKRIHDEKGVKWNKRGIGTIAKGNRADEKFIERALNDNAENISKIFDAEIAKYLKKCGVNEENGDMSV